MLSKVYNVTFTPPAPKAGTDKIQARSEEMSGKISRLTAILEELK